MNLKSNQKGYLLIQTVIFAGIAVFIITGLAAWVGTSITLSKRTILKEKAVQIAEAGIDYYRWHLAHDPLDFTDGTGEPGPYIHNFYDKDEVLIGSFELNITAPPSGSTIVTVQSTGKVIEDTAVSRTIRTTLAIPSLAKYAFVSNSNMRFGAGTEVFGPIHSNGGIRFDGLAHNVVSSSQPDYDDPDHSGANEFGIHTHVNPPPGSGIDESFRPNEAPPTDPVPLRADVFEAGRQLSVPAVDFVGLTADIAQMKTDAQADGRYFADSGGLGYRIVLKNNDKFDIYRVDTVDSMSGFCSFFSFSSSQPGWGSWSVNSETLVEQDADFPNNDLIFVEDHLWVEGVIDDARLTIASGRFPDNPATRTSITINQDLNYTYNDGRDIISLITQNNINVGFNSADYLEIDAALVAQNGRIGRYYYSSVCGSNYQREEVTLYGMIATNQRYGFTWTGSSHYCSVEIDYIGSGYCVRNINYDANLLYGPPPSFPLTSDRYVTISWEEI